MNLVYRKAHGQTQQYVSVLRSVRPTRTAMVSVLKKSLETLGKVVAMGPCVTKKPSATPKGTMAPVLCGFPLIPRLESQLLMPKAMPGLETGGPF